MIRSLLIGLTLILLVSSCGMNKIRYGKKIKAEPRVEQNDVSKIQEEEQLQTTVLNEVETDQDHEIDEVSQKNLSFAPRRPSKELKALVKKSVKRIDHVLSPGEETEDIAKIKKRGLITWMIGGLLFSSSIAILALKLAGVLLLTEGLVPIIIIGALGLIMFIAGIDVYRNPRKTIEQRQLNKERQSAKINEQTDQNNKIDAAIKRRSGWVLIIAAICIVAIGLIAVGTSTGLEILILVPVALIGGIVASFLLIMGIILLDQAKDIEKQRLAE